jgi:hypothetical protein
MAQAQLDAMNKERPPTRKPKPSKRQKLTAEPPAEVPFRSAPLLSDQQLVDPELRRLLEENAKLKLQVLTLTEQQELSKTKKYHTQAERNLAAVLRVGFRSRVELEADCTDDRGAFERLSLKLARAAADYLRQGYQAHGYDMSGVDAEALYALWKENREKRDRRDREPRE